MIIETVVVVALFILVSVVFLFNGILWAGVGLYGYYRSKQGIGIEWGPDDVQARVVTIGDEPTVVQNTVDAIGEHVEDVVVISEKQIETDGATVHVVPDEFETEHAIKKGRALEWARQYLDTDTEYVLYLDEDTLIESFDGLPDNDIIQLQERPRKSASTLAWLADVWRTGTQYEPRGFTALPYPFFLWGGAFAVRTSVEKDVGWDYETVCEDTLFLFRSLRNNYDYNSIDVVGRNQSPPSFREIIEQRRRWASGTIDAIRYLGFPTGLLLLARYIAWLTNSAGLAITGTFLLLGLPAIPVVLAMLFCVVIAALLRATVSALMYEKSVRIFLLLLVLFPFVMLYDGVGVVYGLLNPVNDFRVTEKVSD